MNSALLESPPVENSALLALVAKLHAEVEQLRREVRELRCDVGYWKSRHADAVQRNHQLQQELDEAKAEIKNLKAERFGKQSEKGSSVDRSNDLDDPRDQVSPKKKRGQQPGRPAPRRRDYSHLPAREEQVDLPENAKICDCCGKPLADLGQSDPTEQIEIETFVYRRVVRRKRYRQTCECSGRPQTITAPLPPKLLPKSIYGTSLWIHLLLEKFHLQRPANRIIEQLRLQGLSLAPGTVADGMKRIEPLFTPLYDAIRMQHVNTMAQERDNELADDKLREPCRKVLVSLNEHWSGLTLFVDDPRIPMDNNYSERLVRNPAVGRKNYYGSGAEWSGRLAMMLFSIFATLALWKINPREWLAWYFQSCAELGGRAPENSESFLPWNLSEARLAELQNPNSNKPTDTS